MDFSATVEYVHRFEILLNDDFTVIEHLLSVCKKLLENRIIFSLH